MPARSVPVHTATSCAADAAERDPDDDLPGPGRRFGDRFAAQGGFEGTGFAENQSAHRPGYRIAIGLIGLPVPPTTGSGLAANRNSWRPVAASCVQQQSFQQRDAEVADQPLVHRKHRARWRRASPRRRSCRRPAPQSRVRPATAPPRHRGRARHRTRRCRRGPGSPPSRCGSARYRRCRHRRRPGSRRARGRSRPIAAPSRSGPPCAPTMSSSTPRPTIGPILSMPQRVAPLVLRVPLPGKPLYSASSYQAWHSASMCVPMCSGSTTVSSANWKPPGRRAPAA